MVANRAHIRDHGNIGTDKRKRSVIGMIWVESSEFLNAFFGCEITAESPIGSHWYTNDPMVSQNLLDSGEVFGVTGVDVRIEVFVHGVISCFAHHLQSKNARSLLDNLRCLGWVP